MRSCIAEELGFWSLSSVTEQVQREGRRGREGETARERARPPNTNRVHSLPLILSLLLSKPRSSPRRLLFLRHVLLPFVDLMRVSNMVERVQDGVDKMTVVVLWRGPAQRSASRRSGGGEDARGPSGD